MSIGPNRLLGYVLGVIYLLVGLLGFTVSGAHAFVGARGGDLLGLFAVNGLHNVVHLAVGAVLILGAVAGVVAAKTLNIVVGVVYLAVAVLGYLNTDASLNLLALNMPDHALHAGSAVLLIAFGLAGDRGGARSAANR